MVGLQSFSNLSFANDAGPCFLAADLPHVRSILAALVEAAARRMFGGVASEAKSLDGSGPFRRASNN